MRYACFLVEDDGSLVGTFPDCPGCVTQVDPGQDARSEAGDALEGWLESHLQHGDAPPRPSERKRAPGGSKLLWVEVPARLAAKLSIRWARGDQGLNQTELARRAGVSQQMIAKVEHPDYNPSLDVLEKVARALGAKLVVGLEMPARPHRGRRATAPA